MALHIVEKIEAVSRRIRGNPALGIPPDPDFADELAEAAIAAISAGKDNAAGQVPSKWETLMRFFTDDKTELDRLCGRDPVFNQSQWGRHCLAYIAGDSVCTSETTMRGGTMRSMNEVPGRRMPELLDAEGTDLQMLDKEALSANTSNASGAEAEDSSNTDSSTADTSNDRNK